MEKETKVTFQSTNQLPSGKITMFNEKKITISMVIFNSYVTNYQLNIEIVKARAVALIC